MYTARRFVWKVQINGFCLAETKKITAHLFFSRRTRGARRLNLPVFSPEGRKDNSTLKPLVF
jgi:hypothetical protein